jgi:hypothetical protein
MTFLVQKKMCATCIYRPDSSLSLKKLEDDVRDPHMGFKGHRICHHAASVCCRGFWEAHKDEFPAGQIAQRLNVVRFVHVDRFKLRSLATRRAIRSARVKDSA